MARTVLERIQNPRNRECGCDPDCWCKRTALGRAVRWYFPGQLVGLHHKNVELEQWKRGLDETAIQEWKRSKDTGASGKQPLARVVGFEPCFSVADVPRAVRHYELLGFTTSHHDEDYAFAHRDHLTIHLALAHERATAGAATLYLHVDDANRLAAEWRQAGMDVIGPDDYDYGKREGSHVDPDGNRLRFGSPLRR